MSVKDAPHALLKHLGYGSVGHHPTGRCSSLRDYMGSDLDSSETSEVPQALIVDSFACWLGMN